MSKTKQEIFTKIVTGLRSQGFKRSFDPDLGCLYRGPNGLKCAVGHLIPDDLKMTDCDNRSGLYELRPSIWLAMDVDSEDYAALHFLRALQSIHDFEAEPPEMELKYRRYAHTSHLDFPES